MATTQIIETRYEDYHTGRGTRERKVQDLPSTEMEDVRNKEVALVRAPRGREQVFARDDDDAWAVQRIRRRHPVDDTFLAPPRARDDEDARLQRRRDASPSSSSSSASDSSRRQRRRRSPRRRRGHRRAHSEQPAVAEPYNSEDEGFLWYSMKKRREGNWAERNFDSSYDGLIAGAAGAAIGAITARHFGGDGNKKWKAAGGAVVGAAAFNAAENWYRVYTEEREEQRERWEAEHGLGPAPRRSRPG